jgi:Raf kinase inhibitor-like YbhB/YbcL family protein
MRSWPDGACRVIGHHLLFVLFILLGIAGCRTSPETVEGGNVATLQVTSSAFSEGASIPRKYTCDGENVSPPLSWSAVPAGTESWVVIIEDPDAPSGIWVHWVLYDLPSQTDSLQEGSQAGGVEGRNTSRREGYSGPCPPRGPAHRYFFKVFALDTVLHLKAGATKADVEKAMAGHILAQGQLMGTYSR